MCGQPIGSDTMGAMKAMPPSRPTGILLSPLYTAKKYSKNNELSLWKCKNCADFSLKIQQKRLVAGLRPDAEGELTVLP